MSNSQYATQVLYLVRHGEAKPAHEDPQRGLTNLGQQAVQGVAAWAAKAGLSVDEILHSGKRRAEQTASILATALQPPIPPRCLTGINPNDDVRPVADQIRQDERTIMLVGHLPFMGHLVSQLVLGEAAEIIIDFQPGTLVRLLRDGNAWIVDCVINPELTS